MVTAGDAAPDFIATALVDDEGVSLELFREVRSHEVTLLYFYPADFVSPCTAELCAIRDADWLHHEALTVIGVSGDSLFSHAAYADQHDLSMPLVSDFHGGVAESYDLLADDWEGHRHIPQRAAVVIDGGWEIQTIEREAKPLAWASPAPVERAHDCLRDAGLDVAQPQVVVDQSERF